MAQVNMPAMRQPDDALTTLMKGLTIASQVYGIKSDMAKLDEHEQKQAKQKKLAQGIYDQDDQLALSEKFDLSPNKPEAGVPYQQIQVEDGSGNTSALYAMMKRNTSPLLKDIKGAEGGQSGTLVMDYRDPNNPKKVQFIPEAAPKREKVEFTDDSGNKVTKFVDPRSNEPYVSSAKDQKLNKVTSQTAQEIGSFDAAVDMANQLEAKYNQLASSGGSGLKSFIPGSDANKYEKNRDYAAQTIGVILEKGKLTDRDYDRYRAMLPGPTDTNTIAAEKMMALKNLITAKKRGEIGGLEQSGFQTAGFAPTPTDIQTSIGKKKPDTSGEAIAAPSSGGLTDLEKLKIQANMGNKKAQDFLNSLGPGGQ